MSKNNCKTQYNMWNIDKYNMLDSVHKNILLQEVNQQLKYLSAEDRVAWGLKYLPNQIVLSSSFGLQSVVILHLVTRQYCDIPIILIDTGYLFPETYRYIDQLTEDMKLNLQVFSALKSAAWQEVRYGQLWKQGVQGINKYNYINKVEPMQRAFKICKVSTWFSGLRRSQSSTRKKLQILSVQWGVFKLLPIIDWDDDQVCKYIEMYSLTLHPLWNQGYVSLGDVHTTAKYKVGINKEDTRFFGLKRECGLHEENF